VGFWADVRRCQGRFNQGRLTPAVLGGVESDPIRVEVDPGAVAISDFLAFG
jgi:hypothetical protein